jgi:hypothetical protein
MQLMCSLWHLYIFKIKLFLIIKFLQSDVEKLHVYFMYFKTAKLSYHKQHKLVIDFSDIRLRLFACISYFT